jgi:hypothetical protein
MRDILRRLVLEDDGEAVRWSRVRRLISAYTASGGGGGGGGDSGSDNGASSGGGGGGFGSPFECSANQAAAAVETLAGLAEGARWGSAS